MSWLPDSQNLTRLFLIGGLNSLTNKPIKAIEMYNENNNTWEVYRQLPNYDFKFPESPDYGCLAIFENVIYSVGLSEIVAFDWSTWQISQVNIDNFLKYL